MVDSRCKSEGHIRKCPTTFKVSNIYAYDSFLENSVPSFRSFFQNTKVFVQIEILHK